MVINIAPAAHGSAHIRDRLYLLTSMPSSTTRATTQDSTGTWADRCCPPLAGPSPIGRENAEQLARTLKALADPARLQVLSFLRSRPDGEACACDLVAPLGLAQPTVSHHLKVLFEAGLLEREKRATWVHYRLPDDRLPAVCTALL